MDYKVLYRKYRPQDFDSVIGQEYTTKLLKNSIVEGKISHAYIFTGPRGTGKTSTAKIFAKAINCNNNNSGNPCNKCDVCNNINENPDIIEIDAASNNGVDDIRELIENSRLTPSMSKFKVYIIDEFHMLSTSAFNALLLTLEEPPKNVVFILATTDIQSVPITILSRCQRFDFKPITVEDIVSRLEFVCKKEKINITNDALKEIAYMSNGGLRDALSILDQVSTSDEKIDVSDIVDNFGSVSNKKVNELISIFCNNNVDKLISTIEEFKKNGVDYRILSNKIVEVLKNILVDLRLEKCEYNVNFDNIYNLIYELSQSITNNKNYVDPFIFIEIAFLKYMNVSRETSKLDDKKIDNVSRETLDDEKTEKDNNNLNEALTEETNKDKNVELLNIDIRVNNCFVNAKKDYLVSIKEKWSDFLTYESNANKKLMSYIVDTDIVTASDMYAIITNKLKSTVELINENIKSLEQDFKLFFGKEYKFVCLDCSSWNKEKEKYIFNIKNGKKYSIIKEEEILDDSSINPMDNENVDELEKLASEIFEDNVVIK